MSYTYMGRALLMAVARESNDDERTQYWNAASAFRPTNLLASSSSSSPTPSSSSPAAAASGSGGTGLGRFFRGRRNGEEQRQQAEESLQKAMLILGYGAKAKVERQVIPLEDD